MHPKPSATPDSVPMPVMLALRGRGFGAETEPTPAADAAALSLIGLLIFCVVWIAAAAFVIKRRLRKQIPPEGLKANGKIHPEAPEPHPAWQKPGDWWKQ